jgi:uncharacterized protein (DUF305 family)
MKRLITSVALVATGVLVSTLWWTSEAAGSESAARDDWVRVIQHQHDTAGAPEHSDASNEMHDVMMAGSKHMDAMKMTGDPDHDFAMMMKMHHETGVAMAKIELRDGKDPAMRAMAEKIVASQEKDIREFSTWLAKHGHAGH